MSEKPRKELDAVLHQMLMMRRKCAWCDYIAQNSVNELILHIWDKHEAPPSQKVYEQLKQKVKEEGDARVYQDFSDVDHDG